VRKAPLPRLFVAAGSGRRLWVLGGLVLLAGAAMLPAMATMADHGASLIAFESAGGVSRAQQILRAWGDAGRAAAWWQLALDTAFLLGYGLFLAGACAAVAARARAAGMARLERVAATVAWFGPLAAAADLLQNVSLALFLGGRETQPWPRIAAVAAPVTTGLALCAAAFALCGALATRRRTAAAPEATRPGGAA
jgi:hypothetical protein